MLPLFEGNRSVMLAVDFLKKVKARKGNVKMPDNVLVVGGGDVAMDVVTTLKLLGVEHVSDVVYEQFKEFKASKKELKNAQELGVSIIDGYVPVKAKGKTVTFTHREINSVLKLKADKIILAVGQYPNVEGLGVDGIAVKTQVRVAVPEIGDRVAEEDHVEILALALAYVLVEVPRVVVVRALLRRARIRGMVGARNLAANFNAERAERSGSNDGSCKRFHDFGIHNGYTFLSVPLFYKFLPLCDNYPTG